MHSAAVTRDARNVIDRLNLADYDEEFDYYQALVSDEAFAVAAHRLSDAEVYARHEHATDADQDAVDALRRSVREHAQRVRGEVDNA